MERKLTIDFGIAATQVIKRKICDIVFDMGAVNVDVKSEGSKTVITYEADDAVNDELLEILSYVDTGVIANIQPF